MTDSEYFPVDSNVLGTSALVMASKDVFPDGLSHFSPVAENSAADFVYGLDDLLGVVADFSKPFDINKELEQDVESLIFSLKDKASDVANALDLFDQINMGDIPNGLLLTSKGKALISDFPSRKVFIIKHLTAMKDYILSQGGKVEIPELDALLTGES